jgi:hypothetical protein
VESKYGINSGWKLTPPFQVPSTAIVVSFLHIPSSAVESMVMGKPKTQDEDDDNDDAGGVIGTCM